MDNDRLNQFRDQNQAAEGRVIVGAGAAMFIAATAMLFASIAGVL